MTTVAKFEQMIGVTMQKVTGLEEGSDSVRFVSEDLTFIFEHRQDCCEYVRVYSVDGDPADLIGSPILMAEEVSSDGAEAPRDPAESYTWTFYKFATAKGYVTVRWLGESNGYYSESVDFIVT